jgi:tagaturonate reductase
VRAQPRLELIFSNTTEIGIRLNQDDRFGDAPPTSFPAKLTRFLRARAFDYEVTKGIVVLPCELIENNGAQLEQLVREQAARWHLEPRFFAWLDNGVTFCNTLVDRIVTGEASAAEKQAVAQQLGYEDELLTSCEPYRLFAIEADGAVRDRLRFAAADEGVILTDDISPYRNRKIRLLNGTHTLMAPLALLAGCETVSDALNDELVGAFARAVLLGELAPSMGSEDAEPFAYEVLERFENPFIQHALLDITLQQTTKMAVRVAPAIRDYAARTQASPRLSALGFAAYLLYLQDARSTLRPDEKAAAIRDLPVERVLSNLALWGSDLTAVPGFKAEVVRAHAALQQQSARAAIHAHLVSSFAAQA